MKVLVLNPPFIGRFSRSQRSPAITKSGTLYYPVWLAYATGVLEKAGFNVTLIDAPAAKLTKKKLYKIVLELKPRLIVIDTSTPSIYNDVQVAVRLKQLLPDSFITLVGTHVSVLPEETLELDASIDAVARGEYDYTIRDLAIALDGGKDLNSVLGLTFRRGKDIISSQDRPKINDLDAIPFVSKVYKKHLNTRDYFFAASNYPHVQIFTARGCPFQCFFCVYPQVMHGHVYRARSAQNVVEEFKFIAGNLPEVKEVIIEDDTFTISRDRVQEICRLLLKANNRLKWNANVRADLDLETMKIMKQAGCRLIIVGFESADQTVLDNINKGIKVEHMEQFFVNTRKAGLLSHVAFMVGNPGETGETLEKTFRLAKRLLPDTVQFFPLMVYPGTRAFKWANDENILSTNEFNKWVTREGLHNCVINLPNLSSAVLVNWCDLSRRRYYLSIKYLSYKLKQMFLNPQEIKRTIIAVLQFRKYILRGIFTKKRN